MYEAKEDKKKRRHRFIMTFFERTANDQLRCAVSRAFANFISTFAKQNYAKAE